MKTIIDYNVAFGGYCYRVTANKHVAHIQEMTPRSTRFITKAKLPRDKFDAIADQLNLFDPYNQDPAKLAYLIASFK